MTSPADSDACLALPLRLWDAAADAATRGAAVQAVESGKVVYLPQLPFVLTPEEKSYLRPDCVDGKGKSVKYAFTKDRLWGMATSEQHSETLKNMLRHYAESAHALIAALFPHYVPHLTWGNTSFRPVEAEDRVQSLRHDDRLLHIDSFPSRPSKGTRLLRVFTNIHPGNKPRVWRVGEPFENVAKHFLAQVPPPLPGSASLLKFLHITKDIRTPYDHIMLQLHDRMKKDSTYQREVRQTVLEFPPGSSWIVYTDQVSHAALSGQHALEQTFTLPVEGLTYPERAPLRILERLQGKALV